MTQVVYQPGFEGERLAIETYFSDSWLDGPYRVIPVKYPNIPWVDPDPPEPWVAISISNASSEQASLGGDPVLRFAGLVFVTVHVPAGEGTKEARSLADYVAGIFSRAQIENVQSGRLTFEVTTIDYEAPEPNPAWYAIATSTVFRRHKTASEG